MADGQLKSILTNEKRHAFLVLLFLAASCAVPGRLYLVAPAISGSVRGDQIAPGESVLTRVVIHRESPTLHDRTEASLSAGGGFSFGPVELVIAGHEYSKFYRVFLHLQAGGRDRVIWRANLSRRELAGPVELDCDLERPLAQGQPCWVVDPTIHRWHVSEGKRTYQRLCSSCHGVDGSGGASSASAAHRTPPDLTTIALRHDGRFDRVEIAEWIEGRSLSASHGTRQMPVWGESLSETYERYAEGDELIGATLDPVLAYLESLQEAD